MVYLSNSPDFLTTMRQTMFTKMTAEETGEHAVYALDHHAILPGGGVGEG